MQVSFLEKISVNINFILNIHYTKNEKKEKFVLKNSCKNVKRCFQGISLVCKNLLEIDTDGFFLFFNVIIKEEEEKRKNEISYTGN